MTQTSTILSYVLLFVTLTSASHFALDSNLVLRQHYGVVFKPTQKFRPVSDHWLHTFAFTLPSYPMIRNVIDLYGNNITSGNKSHCLHVKSFIVSLGNVQQNMSNVLYTVLADINHLIPERVTPLPRRRHSRSWLPILGDALKTVLGAATTEDVNRVMSAVDDIRRSQTVAYGQWSKTESDIVSLLNDKLSELQRLENDQRQSMEQQYLDFANTLTDLFSMTSLVPAAMQRV